MLFGWSEVMALPLWWKFFIAGGFGVIIGSFLNVYLYRFHTGRSLAGDSHCLSCGTPLRWYELFPVVSYLALRGRCRSCGSYIPLRYALVELTVGLLFIIGWLMANSYVELLWWWILFSTLLLIVVYDLYHFIIPDAFTLTVGLLALLQLGYLSSLGTPLLEIGLTILAALAGSGFLWLLWWYSGGRWLGFGDVKLMFSLGLLVGAGSVFSLVVLSFWIGAVISIVLLTLEWLRKRGQSRLRLGTGQLTMKSAVPFAPFLVASALMLLTTSFDVLALFTTF